MRRKKYAQQPHQAHARERDQARRERPVATENQHRRSDRAACRGHREERPGPAKRVEVVKPDTVPNCPGAVQFDGGRIGHTQSVPRGSGQPLRRYADALARRVMPFGAWAMAHFPSRRRTLQKPGVVARGRPGEENGLPRSAPAGSPGETHRRSAQPRGAATIPSPLRIMRRSGAKMRFGPAGAVSQPGTAPKYRPWPAENTSSRCRPGSLACRRPFRVRR